MKLQKLLLFTSTLCIYLNSNAQVVTVKDKNGVVLNDKIYTHVDDNGSSTPDTVKLITALNDTFSINTEVTITRFNVTRCSSSENYFCWAQCYTTAITDLDVYTGPDKLTMVPGEDTSVFSAYHLSYGETGNATYRFGFSVKGNVDTSFVDVTFQVAGTCDELSVNTKIESAFSVFPNPAKNLINIKNNVGSVYHVSVFDAKGQLVSAMNDSFGSITINTSNFGNGIYFIKIADRNGNYFSKRIIISK